jgi:hypothetical protein
MRHWIAALLLLFGLAGTAAAADAALPDAAEQAAIRGVIEQQIDAFRRDDGDGAFGHASPGIQAMFGTPENFMAMVRSGYPSVYRPRHLEFRDLEWRNGRLVQPVLVIGPDGVPVLALYAMERQSDGNWRIDGCALAAIADKAA